MQLIWSLIHLSARTVLSSAVGVRYLCKSVVRIGSQRRIRVICCVYPSPFCLPPFPASIWSVLSVLAAV